MGQKKKAILITLDALAGTEYEAIQKLPNFSHMLRSGACCPYERSVYPSLTFPCHASIATGCNPGTHGIVSNYLPEPGLERPQDGLVAEYRAYLDSCDGMAYIYLNKELQGDRQETLDLVRACFRDHPGVKAVLEPSELRALGGDPDADLALEAKEGYYFKSGRWPDGTLPDRNGIAPADHKAVHGYLPEDPDYYTMMLAYGPDVRPGIVERMGLIDILPTLCQWMDIPFGPVEGTVIPGLLQDPEQ